MAEQLDKEAIRALGTATRQTIIKALERRPYTASELAKATNKHVTTVAEHLAMLEKSGLIRRREDGHKWKYYALSDKGAKLFKPQFYTWTVMLCLAIIAIFAGGIFSQAGAQYDKLTAFDQSASAPTAGAQISAPAESRESITPIVEANNLVWYVIMIIGLIVAILAISRLNAMRKT